MSTERTFAGRTAVITGGARGQGRSHAVALANLGANIVLGDILEDIDTIPYELGTKADLEETIALVEAAGGKVVATKADVRSTEDMAELAKLAIDSFGRIDILLANAGVHEMGPFLHEFNDESWQNMLDVNLTGVWKAARAVVPHMIEGGRGGSIVITSSVDGLRPAPGWGHYSSAKHGVEGLMKTMAFELAKFNIRVNTVNPTGVNTPMAHALLPHVAGVMEQFPHADRRNLIDGVETVEPSDITNAILFLASDDARFVTGQSLAIDAGWLLKA
ncbi:mycofactocin-coupled SDR family oxidoreductase [Rhodococcus erythropolis]